MAGRRPHRHRTAVAPVAALVADGVHRSAHRGRLHRHRGHRGLRGGLPARTRRLHLDLPRPPRLTPDSAVREYLLARAARVAKMRDVSESFTLELDGAELHGERWPGDGPVLVLLHEGVSDLRGWRQTAEILSPAADVVAYDRRGYGRTRPGTAPYTHVDDL